jgi:hypothetical protein
MRVNDDEYNETPIIPVSPSTKLDPEVNKFLSRIMTGYESAHSKILELAEIMAKSARDSQEAISRATMLQIKLAEEREELISKRHKRDLEAAAALDSQKQKATLLGDVRAIGLLAAKKHLGIPLTGNDTHGFQDFIATMTGDQIQQLMTSGTLQLTTAQQTLLSNTLSGMVDKDEALAEKLSALPDESEPEAAE